MTQHLRPRLFAGLLLALSCLVAAVHADIIEQVLLKVNGEIFTKSDLEARQVATLRQLGQQVDPNTNPSDAQLRKMLDDVTPQLIVGIVDEMLMVQRGKELGYKLTEDRFQSVIDSIKKDNKISTEEEFQAAMKQEKITLADFRRNVERQMMMQQVQQNEVLGKVAVSEVETRRYYESHRKDFTTQASVTLREILVSVPRTASAADESAAQQKIAEIRQQVTSGASFEKLASEVSDAPSRANAGLVGPLNLDEVAGDLRKAIEQLKVGDVTEALRGQNGFQILKLESSTPPKTMPFERARDEISNRVFADKRKQELLKYLNKLRGEAIIDFKNADLKKAYEQGLAQEKAGSGGA